ncbi:hypothetical protein F5148DRAFT_1285533 [Russula earlei]|uniref:Uncharacterized protein n=1 Tax=Russula earlei TaxID=71964 RepID=A0ACC0U6C4_9AGAM|nr:hypothetical protein F5148DRAFT_1285533 [Russula earlei]
MTSKPPAISPGSSGSVALARHPPSIDLSNKLLSSAIPLPPNASILYAVFSPTTSPTLHADTIERARTLIFDTGKPSLLDSLLCTTHVGHGGQQLYVFSILPSDGEYNPSDTFKALQFDGLISSQIHSFRPSDTHSSKQASFTKEPVIQAQEFIV